MRQSHVAGEKMFVDYAGATLEVIDGLTGEVRAAQIFVATLGASSYTYAEATWTQALPNWIGSHTIASNRSFRPWNRPVDGCGRCAQPADLLPRWTFTVSPIAAPHGSTNGYHRDAVGRGVHSIAYYHPAQGCARLGNKTVPMWYLEKHYSMPKKENPR